MTTFILKQAEAAYEDAHIAAMKAVDGDGKKVMLLRSSLNVDSVRKTTKRFADTVLSENNVFLTGMQADTPSARKGELAAIRNLILMLKVLEAGVSYEQARELSK